MKKLLACKTPVDALLLQGRLEIEGIRCEVRRDSLMDIYGIVIGGDVGSPSVWIARDEDLPRALEVANATAKASGWPWTCARCGESNEPAFDACWSCGTARGDPSGAPG